MSNTRLSPHFILQNVYDPVSGKLKMDGTINVAGSGNIINFDFDSYVVNYLVAGNGAGEPGTIQYYTGGVGGTLVGTITYTYDGSNRISTVTRS